MPQCKWCGKKGIFLTLDKYGLCDTCHHTVIFNITQIVNLINSSIDVMQKSKNLDTKLSRLELIEQKYRELLNYEKAGIVPSNKRPSEVLKEIPKIRDETIIEYFKEKSKEINTKVEAEISPNQKTNLLNKFYSEFLEYKHLITLESNKLEAERFEQILKALISKYEYENLLEKAKKAEFKGQKKVALNAYYDVLYYLRNNHISDTLELDKIEFVKSKILELGGTLPPDLPEK